MMAHVQKKWWCHRKLSKRTKQSILEKTQDVQLSKFNGRILMTLKSKVYHHTKQRTISINEKYRAWEGWVEKKDAKEFNIYLLCKFNKGWLILRTNSGISTLFGHREKNLLRGCCEAKFWEGETEVLSTQISFSLLGYWLKAMHYFNI